jgi:hypothetical protein
MTNDPDRYALLAERAVLAHLYAFTGDLQVLAETLDLIAGEIGPEPQAWRAVAEYAARQCASARAVVDGWSLQPTALGSAIDFTEAKVAELLPPLRRLRIVRDPK